MKEVLSKHSDGQVQTLKLPDLTPDGIKALGLALERIRISCVVNQRSRIPPYLRIHETLKSGYPYAILMYKLFEQEDVREKIIQFGNDDSFHLFIQLMYDVGQDFPYYDDMELVLKGFGFMEPSEGKE